MLQITKFVMFVPYWQTSIILARSHYQHSTTILSHMKSVSPLFVICF
ncbi:hypothetical protein GLYMA_10G224700v4 [Glycine max]|uniref:Uncharacterized protein n=1 Tax=Glycine max TaxID=3847 RepID=A0A0R0I4X9_SOYBN|nr:hypothetical protein GYH30_028808 [Glycine max]KRH35141.1 hypothetical protein GLYMA_10G224700v4 [Glycine max]